MFSGYPTIIKNFLIIELKLTNGLFDVQITIWTHSETSSHSSIQSPKIVNGTATCQPMAS